MQPGHCQVAAAMAGMTPDNTLTAAKSQGKQLLAAVNQGSPLL